MDQEIQERLRTQAGVIARHQLREAGARPCDLERMLRRRDLSPVHRGVFVNHTGELTWAQLAWAGVLAVWPAALWGPTALCAHRDHRVRAAGESVKDGTFHVAVEHGRRLVAPAGVTLHRVRRLDGQVRWNLGPPRQRIEHAVLDAAGCATTRTGRIGVVTAVANAGASTVERIRRALDARSRIRDREWWQGVLTDLAEGTNSVLEHAYLVNVERAHGLPAGRRQARVVTERGVTYRDVDYDGLVVELDGHAFHNSAVDRTRDLARDLRTAIAGVRTVRLSYGQVFDDPCGVAVSIAALLHAPLRPCGPRCALPPSA